MLTMKLNHEMQLQQCIELNSPYVHILKQAFAHDKSSRLLPIVFKLGHNQLVEVFIA